MLRDVAARAAAAEVLAAEEDGALLGTVTFVPDGGPLGEIARPGRPSSGCSPSRRPARAAGSAARCSRTSSRRAAPARKAGVVCSSQPAMRAAHRVYERLGFRRAPERDWSPVPGMDLYAFTLVL